MTDTSTLRLEPVPAQPNTPANAKAAPSLTVAHEQNRSGPHEAAEPVPLNPQRFEFTGSGGEYFRIWVVNLLLTILTLGVYSAWAKVRRLQYFYRNTRVAGDIFDYHGNPTAILKGRILALVLLVAYKLASEISMIALVIVGIVLMGIMPWLLARAFRFKLANSSYRGLHFRFHGTVAQAYRMLILFPIILTFIGVFAWSVFTSFDSHPRIGLILLAVLLLVAVLMAGVPLAHYLLKRFQHDNAYYGQSPFFFHATAGSFFKIYVQALLLALVGGIPASIFGFLTGDLFNYLAKTPFGWLFIFLYSVASAYASSMVLRAFVESRIQNLVWNNTELADVSFESTVSARNLLWIHASNLALIMLTAGLYKPFATVRLVKYRLASLAILPHAGLDEFFADQAADGAGALGQEAGEFFDIDIAL
ncbi:uncharacterized membrane protein YjgN (DUF898 family) [Paucimonas lemoignei]|uniref:Uncharacterized membrane protein YjgN (DUF898 family) n=1 Tax=Paucimonas lemoignei TaxID=29443 RepID=A0A4R3HSS3_PAULE|nr:YjgN family protein [Paucimonas lemoignei]TCS36216.1 uncharacterized membrane protein YjgN (DUF898 family) [Paucimonas lemoignei]